MLDSVIRLEKWLQFASWFRKKSNSGILNKNSVEKHMELQGSFPFQGMQTRARAMCWDAWWGSKPIKSGLIVEMTSEF